MSTLSLIPTYQYSTGEVLTAAVLNNPLSAIQAWSSTIDNTNIGTAGVFASQLKPTNTTQSTFGGSVGYTFLAPASSYVPLTVSGVSGQSVDLFDVTPTSGGAVALGVTPNGSLKTAVNSTQAEIIFGSGTTSQTGNIVYSGNTWTFTPQQSSGSVFTIATAGIQAIGTVQFNSGNAPASTDFGIARAASTAVMYWGTSATTSGFMDYGVNSAGGFSFRTAAGAFVPLFGGAYTNSSDASLKENVAPITGALATLMQLKPSSYNWIADGQADLGFIAQDVQNVVPELVRTSEGGMGLVYTGFIALLAAAFQEYVAAHP